MTGRENTWFIVVPPDGAAREAGFETATSFEAVLGRGSCKTFDSRKYLDFFRKQLKNPQEDLVVDLFNHALVVQCLDFGAGNCLVCALSPVTLFTLNLLRTQAVKTSHWFYEDYRKAQYWKFLLAGYDFFFAIQKGPLPAACAKLGSRYSFLPTAASSYCCAPYGGAGPANRLNDIVFVGIPSSYRIDTLEFLAQKGFSCVIAGLGWDRYSGPLKDSIISTIWTDGKNASDLLKTAKVGINLSVSSPDTDRENTHVGPRAFDVLASGCSLVTEDVPLARETLTGLHYHTFSGKEDAARRISAVLSDLDSEQAACIANRAIVCQEHSFGNRAREIIRITGGL
jgi:hypothetical protein